MFCSAEHGYRNAPWSSLTSAAKAATQSEFKIAALKRLRHPKAALVSR